MLPHELDWYFHAFPLTCLFLHLETVPSCFWIEFPFLIFGNCTLLIFWMTFISPFWKWLPLDLQKLYPFRLENFSCTCLLYPCFSNWLVLCCFYLFLSLWIFLIFSWFPIRVTTHWEHKDSCTHLFHLAHPLGSKIKYNWNI